ncbi:choice-of-anchor J domain-containing protein, partial [Winogradskyella sp.]|uniref:choice-of-anchor J domain-containing protein n=1 Tax=Winogradskyella sp. TaxID=1883156 RepID=UPI003AB661F6
FDFTSLVNPVIELSIWWESEFSWDGMVLQSSIDSGNTWQNVGTNGDPNNWFNDNTIGGNPGGQQIGWTGRDGSGSDAWLVAKHELTGLGGESNVLLRVAFGSDGSGNDEGVAFDTVNIHEPSCLDVTAITIDSFTDTEATFSWTAGDTETDWEYVIQTAGTGEPAGSGTAIATTSQTETGLIADTAYEVYVRANCLGDGFSAWVGPINFTTACTPISTFTENFDAVTTPDLPTCWGKIIDNGASSFATVVTSTSADNTVPNGVSLTNSNSGSTANIMLVSPNLSNLGDGTHLLRFFARNTTATQDLEIGTLSDPTDGSTFTLLSTVDINTTFAEYEVSFASYSGTDNYIAIRRLSTSTYTTVYLDDIVWEALPPCPKITDLTVDTLAETTAEISWTAGLSETDWEYVLQPAGTGVPITSGTATTTNPLSFTGLTSNTAYEVYVRADCTSASNGYSEWVGPLTFTTECGVISSLPWTEDAEASSTTLSCWSILDNNADSDTWSFNTSATYANSGTQSFQMYTDYNSGSNDDYLISPQLTLTGNEQLRFQQRVRSSGEPNDFTVLLSTTGTLAADFTNTILANASYSNTTYQEIVVDLSAYTGDVYIAFHVPPGGLDGYYLYLDDITVETIPTCYVVTDITIDSFTDTEATISWTTANTETDWEIVVQPDGTGIPASAGDATTTNPHTESGLLEKTDYEVYVRANCLTNGFSAWVGPVTFSTLPSCPDVSSIAIDSFTATDATISWTAGDAETAWEIVVQADGLGEPAGSGTATTANPHTEMGLTEQTAYEVYVRANCTSTGDGFSAWVGPVTFTTDCDVYTPDYTEDFTTFLNPCWEQAGDGDLTSGPSSIGSSNWHAEEFAHVGSGNGAVNINIYSTGDIEWLMSPFFDLSAGGYEVAIDVALTKWNSTASGTFDATDEVRLVYSLDGTNWTTLQLWNQGNSPSNTGDTVVSDISAITGSNVQFALYVSEGASGRDIDFHIDNFKVRVPPSCLDITGLTIDSFTASEVTVSWTANNGETDWEVAVQPDGTGTPASGTATTTNPHTQTGLTGETDYEIYVKANCGPGNEGNWVGPVDFTTPCDAITSYPYLESFESITTGQPDCWSVEGTTTTASYHFSSFATGFSGRGMRFNSYYNPSSRTSELITQTFDASALTSLELKFQYKNPTAGNFEVLVSSDGGASYTSVATGLTGQTDWTQVSYDLSTYISTNVVVKFIGTSNYGSGDAYIYLDEVLVREIPTCPEPTDLTVDSFDRESATISWTAGASETDWEIVVQPDGTGPPAAAGVATSTNPHTETGLTAATDYEVYVRANCGPSDLSAWVGPIDFTTANPLPTVDTTLNVASCGTAGSDSYNGAYDASTQNVVWAQLNYTGSCPSLTIDTIGSDFNTEIGIYDENGVFIGSNDSGGTGVTPQSLFTELGLANGTYYIAAGMFNVTFGPDFNVTSSNTTQTGTLYINAKGQSTETADFNNLQWPINGTINEGDTYNVYSRIYEAGVTDLGSPGANIEAWIGYSTTDATTTADFTSGWTWVPATFHSDEGNDDEFEAEIGSSLLPGVYYYVSRFAVDGGPFTYGGINTTNPSGGGNTWDGTPTAASGQLTVNSLSIPTTIATFNIDGCADSDTVSTAYDSGSATDVVWVELIYDGNCTEITVDTLTSSFDTEMALYDTFGNVIATNDDFVGLLSLITEEGLPAGTYYIGAAHYTVSFGANFSAPVSNTTQTGTIVINASTPNFIDYCNLQYPNSGTIAVGGNYDVYAQVLEVGRTEAAGQAADIDAWIGYSTTDATDISDFASGWTWVPSTYNTDAGDNDEYVTEIGSGLAIGTYYY